MKKVFISQPMRGFPAHKISEVRGRARLNIMRKYGYIPTEEVSCVLDKIRLANEEDVKNVDLYYLAYSIDHMSKCDAVYFCKGWENARGCRIEHECAKQYGLEILYEDGFSRLELHTVKKDEPICLKDGETIKIVNNGTINITL